MFRSEFYYLLEQINRALNREKIRYQDTPDDINSVSNDISSAPHLTIKNEHFRRNKAPMD